MASTKYGLRGSCGGGGKVVVVMVPFPAQGHLNQLLQLSRLISSYNIPVHFVGTATHNRQARLRVHGWNPLSAANIHFHEFPTANAAAAVSLHPNPPAESRFPAHLLSSYQATSLLRDPVGKLLRALAANNSRVVVIHDSLMGSVVQDAASIPNAESYIFHSVSAFTIFLFIWEKMGKPFAVDADILRDLPSLEGCFSPEFERFLKAQYDFLKFNSGRIYNTCRALEAPFLELLSREEISGKKKQWALGPFNPVHVSNGGASKTTHQQRHKCLAWLDNHTKNSVIFVSFGTTTSFSDEQIREIATGLERSEQKFVWVLRDADKTDIFSKEHRKIELPRGFEERVRKRGLVVRDWAPQLEVLAHTSTGGFLSHCGWNSCMESISMGVPMAAWPMHSDQPRNTVLVTKVLRIGIVVKDWDRRDQIVTSSAVEHAVKRLMATEEGERMRQRAADFGCAMKKAVADGGVSRMELDGFVDHIARS
ncbi:PREDICTED: zeatin O-glucosyltransferase-like [Ipomoea nil]|uniref:zeatin O-glucosyltransferase-like n=1 Tax=Ipomoea nil TaxID=35883 RepID=UPI000900A5FD|nr:PREDICTED: zeatin O-glucosyltransferase-like [Ipomoea nil]